MVDLHDSFRPAEVSAPTPVAEIAARAARRKRRRMASTAGLVTATVGIAALAISALSRPPDDNATVADGVSIETSTVPSTATSITTPTSTATEEPPPTATETVPPASTPADTAASNTPADATTSDTLPGGAQPTTTPGIRTSTTVTSEWADGYCVQIDVVNESTDAVRWQIVVDLGGSIASMWNATATETADGDDILSGEDGYNVTLPGGGTTSFGTCVDR